MFLTHSNGSDNLFPTIFEEFSRILEPLDSSHRSGAGRATTFPVDVLENGDSYQISVDLPGVSKEQIEVSLEDQVLEISVKPLKEEGESAKMLLQERRKFSGMRKFSLPEVADGDAIEANLEAGVLTIHVPKQAKKEPVKITVS